MSKLTKERREELREAVICSKRVGQPHLVDVSDMLDLLDALDEMEAERDEARRLAEHYASIDQYVQRPGMPWEPGWAEEE